MRDARHASETEIHEDAHQAREILFGLFDTGRIDAAGLIESLRAAHQQEVQLVQYIRERDGQATDDEVMLDFDEPASVDADKRRWEQEHAERDELVFDFQ